MTQTGTTPEVKKWYPGEGKVTPLRLVLYILVMLGLISGAVRLFFALTVSVGVAGTALLLVPNISLPRT